MQEIPAVIDREIYLVNQQYYYLICFLRLTMQSVTVKLLAALEMAVVSSLLREAILIL